MYDIPLAKFTLYKRLLRIVNKVIIAMQNYHYVTITNKEIA